jgi:hypothetical protein
MMVGVLRLDQVKPKRLCCLGSLSDNKLLMKSKTVLLTKLKASIMKKLSGLGSKFTWKSTISQKYLTSLTIRLTKTKQRILKTSRN